MNIRKSFIDYMVSKGLGFFSDDRSNDSTQIPIFAGAVPLDGPQKCWWVLTDGGGAISKNQTGEKRKNYALSVYYRSKDAEDVDDTLQAFEEMINDPHCDQLDGFDTIEMEATAFAADEDIDNVERSVGFVQVTITTYR